MVGPCVLKMAEGQASPRLRDDPTLDMCMDKNIRASWQGCIV